MARQWVTGVVAKDYITVINVPFHLLQLIFFKNRGIIAEKWPVKWLLLFVAKDYVMQ